jgi:hypothetical protein
MARQLANLDYLISQPKAAAQTPVADQAIQEATIALGVPIVVALYKAGGTQSAFQLVDALNIRLEDLFRVLDILSNNLEWVAVDRSDPKGNYQVSLTPRGREYAQKSVAAVQAP